MHLLAIIDIWLYDSEKNDWSTAPTSIYQLSLAGAVVLSFFIFSVEWFVA